MSALLPVILTFAGATFLTAGVKIGDQLVPVTVTNPAFTTANSGNALIAGQFLKTGANPTAQALSYDQLLISEVTSETALKVIAYKNGVAITDSSQSAQYDVALATTDSFTYNIVHNLSKDEQVTQIINSIPLASKRTLYVWPPQADWDGNGTIVNGSAIAACVAAAMSAYPAQQGFTNLGFPGPYQLMYSNTYFTPAQLNRLTDGGVFVLVQDAPGGQVYARHQKTTSKVSIQEEEFSITKAVDKLSLDISAEMKPYIGKYNITQDLLTQLNEVLKQYLFTATNNKSPYCGSLIISATNVIIRANLDGANLDLNPGTIEVSLTVEVGYPANYINVLVYVQ